MSRYVPLLTCVEISVVLVLKTGPLDTDEVRLRSEQLKESLDARVAERKASEDTAAAQELARQTREAILDAQPAAYNIYLQERNDSGVYPDCAYEFGIPAPQAYTHVARHFRGIARPPVATATACPPRVTASPPHADDPPPEDTREEHATMPPHTAHAAIVPRTPRDAAIPAGARLVTVDSSGDQARGARWLDCSICKAGGTHKSDGSWKQHVEGKAHKRALAKLTPAQPAAGVAAVVAAADNAAAAQQNDGAADGADG
jgi:hypothetical protein